MRARVLGVLLAVAAAALVSGCVSVPDSGPVVETRSEGQVESNPGIFIDPRPPRPGDTPPEIVDGFLGAMQAVPIQTKSAREYLSQDASAAWNPQEEMITYAEPPAPRDGPIGVSVTLSGANHLDARGAWQGAVPPGRRTITFPMVREDGEWRIDTAPDALVVPENWFELYYRQVSLYYFDPTARILAPEPVFVPSGEQLATTLTQALLRGPGEDMQRVAQSFVPPGLEVSVGVTVSDDGVADVRLDGDGGQLTPQTTELMMAQFAWTLRQDPAIESIRVSIGGEPVPLPGGASSYRVDSGAEYDPAGFQASPLLYGLRDGRVVSGTATGLEPVDGPLGDRDLGLRSIGTSLDARAVAGVGGDGSSLLVGDLGDLDRKRVRTVVTGAADLLRPTWDFADRVWLVDRTARGARVSYVEGNRVEALRVPGISGEQVRMFLVSRDGTRLVAVVRRGGADRLIVSRIEHTATGRVLGATRAERIGADGDTDLPIRAIAWTTADRVAVLNPFTPSLAEVRSVSVDGSPAGTDAVSVAIEARLRGLAGSPASGEPLYGLMTDRIVEIADQRVIRLEPRTTNVAYVG